MTGLLLQINDVLVAAVLIVSFSLLVYVALHNWRSDVARALCNLLMSAMIVYGGDVLIGRADQPYTIQFLLRAQWLGIALVPAAYLHLRMALLKFSHPPDQREHRRWPIWGGYIGSVTFFLLVLHTDLVVRGGITSDIVVQFNAGPLFWLYVLLFAGSIWTTLHTIMHAQRHALTPTLRRRLNYLRATFFAPGLGVFPYLVIAGGNLPLSNDVTLLLASLVNVAVVVMITVMAYSIGFQGVPMPDRLIKQDFVRWCLYGPTVGVTIILCIQIVPWLDNLLGLPSDTLITFVVMMMTALMPIFVTKVRPYLDALVYMQDQEEIDYLRKLPRSIFTGTDLRQLLENTLIAVCGALNVETGLVIGTSKESYSVKAWCGSRRDVRKFVEEHPLNELMARLEQTPAVGDPATAQKGFVSCNGFCLLPLRSPDGVFVGALGVAAHTGMLDQQGAMTTESHHLIDVLSHHMELAMTTVQMQQRIFENLRGLDPEMQSLQQLTTQLEQATPDSLASIGSESEVALHPQFQQLVKDALSHYWGGPKLSDSPLLGLRTVRRAIKEQGGSPTRALQTVLRQAITNLRPDEQLDPSAQEWLLYNILELRFLQGKRIRDVASHLAMSESDFYRKQRIAVEQVARQLALMEDGEKVPWQVAHGPSQGPDTRKG